MLGVLRRGILDYRIQCYCSFCGIVYKIKDVGNFCPICHKILRFHPRNYGLDAKKRQFERSI